MTEVEPPSMTPGEYRIAFLLARIAEDEAVAIRICPGRSPDNGHWNATSFEFAKVHDRETTKHIVRHDPARVLAECEAKRRIIAAAFVVAAKIDGEWGCCHTAEQIRDTPLSNCYGPYVADEFLNPLTLPYADHPDYRP